MSRVTQDEFSIPNVKRRQHHNASRRKSETELTKSKLIIPPHHLEHKSTLSIRQSDVKAGALLVAKNVSFFRRPKEFWFVLNCDHSFFSYYKSRQDYMMGNNACGVINISKCSVVIDPENRGQFIITETRFKSFKLIAANDNERNSWVQALQLQRAYWNKSKRSKEKMLLQQQLTLSDTHTPITNQRQRFSEKSPLSLRQSFFRQNSSSIEEPHYERSSSLSRSSSLKPFTISFKLSPVPRRTFFTRKKSGSVENMQFVKPCDSANPNIPSNDSPFASPINILQKDLTRSISFDTVRKPSPLQIGSPLIGSMNTNDDELVQDSRGEVFIKYSGGHFLDEDLSDEEDIVCEYGNQPSTLIGAQLIIRNCQRDLREAKREIERLKSREQGYKDLLNHRDQQLLELEEQIEEGVIGNLYHARPYRRDNSTASSRMSRRIEELNHQLTQQKRVEEIMYTEVQNLEKLLFRKDAELQLASDKYEETSKALRQQRERHLNLIGYGITHILGNRNMIISEHMRDGGQTDIKQYSLEERLHHDVTWLWRYCRSEDKELPDLNVEGGTVEDKYGDTLEPSQEDSGSLLDSVRFLTEHLTEQSAQLNTFHHIPFKEKKEMKRLVRKGLPDLYRKSVWLYAIRLQINIIRKGQPKNIYEQLVSESNRIKTSVAKDIDLDLYRTFPANTLFRDNEKSMVPTLRRILLAYSVFDPKIGYCQVRNTFYNYNQLPCYRSSLDRDNYIIGVRYNRFYLGLCLYKFRLDTSEYFDISVFYIMGVEYSIK
ncbi:TBC1 domain family member 2A isoform X1 [Oopsacas minuta]|uniref:TBC1 domain family member 2A isoform X1 n=1 Tax=Oopsacas minuta TaxID=111878 RepID=A0AAV7JYH9_9METZ|nr:TBC1 domain family member 2A isoform X1 [Oopsacas minuta]